MSHITEMGQLVDLITAPEEVVDLSKFSLDKCVSSFRIKPE
jgi:farnesyl diphosphate synthase